jgi:hypothetical protein
MTTQKFMGKNQLIDRLSAQIGSRETALEVLKKRGHVDDKGNLTAAGKKRDAMTAEERALDRASTRSATGKKPTAFKYNPKTNTATLRKKY